MAKRVAKAPEWLQAPHVYDTYSLSGCVSEGFADYTNRWKHNGHWLFNSPDVIQEVSQAESSTLAGVLLFYYEVHEMEFDGENWLPYRAEPSLPTNVVIPESKQLEGFDVVTFSARSSPECSPLSCNSLAKEVPVNEHCLLSSFDEALAALNRGVFNNSEPGPYRIFAVYTVPWPSVHEPVSPER
jgi:hypothetical protein